MKTLRTLFKQDKEKFVVEMSGKPCSLERSACGLLCQDDHRPGQSAGSGDNGRNQKGASDRYFLGDE